MFGPFSAWVVLVVVSLLLLSACTPYNECLDGPERFEEACDEFWAEHVDQEIMNDD